MPKKVLIVDDDRGLRQIYARYLAAEGFDVSEASDSAQAINESRKPELDLVLLDMRMPDKEGHSLLPLFRSSHPAAKVIISSCYDVHFQQRKVEGADAYFNKTEGCDALLVKIKSILSDERR